MGFMGNTISCCQFRVAPLEGEGVRLTPQEIMEALMRRSFRSINDTADERSVGWVSLFDPAAPADFFCTPLHVGDFIAVSLRVDQRRVPVAVLQEKVKAAEAEFIEKNPTLRRVPKRQREEIKERVRQELLAKTLPVPTVYDVVWNLTTHVVTLCTTSARGLDLVDDAFRKTFDGYRLRLITPYERAFAIADRGDMDGDLLLSLQAANKATTASVLDDLRSNTWIGTDFLLWLLWHEQDGGYVRPEVTAYIDAKITLAGAGDQGHQKIACSGDQSQLAAVKAALADGKQIIAARIFMEHEDTAWAVTLDVERFNFTAYSCPKVILEKGDTVDVIGERQAVFLERVAVVEKGRELFTGIFRDFLRDRLTIEWAARSADIAEWVGGDHA